MNYITGNWSFDPFVVVVLFTVIFHEIGLSRLANKSAIGRTKKRRLRSYSFYAGLGVLLLAVDSPIDYWASYYFFVHMIEHLLIAFFAPILIVVGAPWVPLMHVLPVGIRRSVGRTVAFSSFCAPLRKVAGWVMSPLFALASFNVSMVIWHLPGLYDLAENNQMVHIWLMHTSFFATGVLFWMQIIPSHPFRPKVNAFWQGGAIIGTNIVMFILAMALSIFTTTSWYPVYNHLPGITLSPFADQQIGASILWVCGDFWAVPALIMVIRRAIETDGSVSGAIERIVHRTPAPSVPTLPSTPPS